MAWAAVAAGAMNIAGSLTSSLMSADQAQVTRKFIRRMDNTKYERSMRDMRRAGLNPMLAYSQGTQSTAAGPTGVVSDMGQVGSRAVEAGTSAREVGRKESRLALEKKLLKQQERESGSRQFLADQQSGKLHHESNLLRNATIESDSRAEFDRSKTGQQLIKAGRAAELAAAPISSAVGAVSPWRRGSQPR